MHMKVFLLLTRTIFSRLHLHLHIHSHSQLLFVYVGDLLLTQYLTYELSKGEASFYYPYIKILPEPGSISKWSDAELDELQHEQLKHRAERKRSQIKIVYNGLMTALNARHPDFFSPHVFTIDRFCFAFDTIQVI
jgi:hypothetical protein